MRHAIFTAFAALVSLLLTGSVLAELGPLDVQVNLSGGNTGNLIRDNTNLETSKASTGVDLGMNAFSWLKLQANVQRTLYGQVPALDNLVYGVGGALIPLSEQSPIQIYLTGHFRDREYRDQLTDVTSAEFSSGEYDATASAAWIVSQSLRVRSGVSYSATSYGLDDVRDRKTYELFGGLNVSLPGRLALDIESGVVLGNLDYVPQRTGGIRPDRSYEVLEQGDLNLFYVSPRLSRQFGRLFGLSLTASHRAFTEKPDSAVVYGHSTNILSPWVSSYEGDGMVFSAKSYILPQFILTAGAGYWNRDYLTTVEGVWRVDLFTGDLVKIVSTVFAQERSDQLRRVYFKIQRPFTSHAGYIIEPSLHLAYTYNSSTIDVYDYHDFSISLGLSFRI